MACGDRAAEEQASELVGGEYVVLVEPGRDLQVAICKAGGDLQEVGWCPSAIGPITPLGFPDRGSRTLGHLACECTELPVSAGGVSSRVGSAWTTPIAGLAAGPVAGVHDTPARSSSVSRPPDG